MPEIELEYHNSENPPFRIGEKVEALTTPDRGGWHEGDILTIKEIYWNESANEWIVKVMEYPNIHSYSYGFKKLVAQIPALTEKDYRRKGFSLCIEPPKTFTKKERQEVAKLYQFRKKIAEVYLMSPDSAKAIHQIRSRVLQAKQQSEIRYLVNRRYNIFVSYNDSIRQQALTEYRMKLKIRRMELKKMNEQLSPYGFCMTQKIHTLPNGILNFYYQKTLAKAKYPDSLDAHYIGIEIECMIPQPSDLSKFRGFAKKLSLIGDSSIHVTNPGYKSQEIRLLTKVSEYRRDVTALCQTLADMKAEVNESCGLHVHLDMRGQDREVVKQRFVNLVKSQKYLQGLVDEKRRKNNFCKPTRNLDPYTQSDRYHAINGKALNKYNTLEIRLHHGSMDAKEIIHWITLLLGIIKAEPIKRAAPTVKSFLEKLDISEEVKEYVRTTIAKHTPVMEDTIPAETDETLRPPSISAERTQFTTPNGCGIFHEDICSSCLICGGHWGEHDNHRCVNAINRGVVPSGTIGRFPECEPF